MKKNSKRANKIFTFYWIVLFCTLALMYRVINTSNKYKSNPQKNIFEKAIISVFHFTFPIINN
ncbi:hypothetical protein A1Q5_08265 [Aliivibrio logei 5S-186]|uniref:Uncharacterized protein n=1 Tax=Aliivibrio logei 5S-186 TaxID=626086 RepID=A0ABX3AUI8_ALILO|nr:hypothetical protein A1Q5_08265 [Aliivibrio logei 5S-186]